MCGDENSDEPVLGMWNADDDGDNVDIEENTLLIHLLSMLVAALVECELDIPADAE